MNRRGTEDIHARDPILFGTVPTDNARLLDRMRRRPRLTQAAWLSPTS